MAENLKLKDEEVAVAMVPLQAQGHLNQLFQLSCTLISTYSLPVYFLGTATYNHQAWTRANSVNPNDLARIHFHDLSIPPDLNDNSLNDVCIRLREPIASFLREVSSKTRRVVVIQDSFMAYNVQDVACFPNVESYMFICVSAFMMWCSVKCPPVPLDEDLLKKLPSFEGCNRDEVTQAGEFQTRFMSVRSLVLSIYNTNRVIEGSSIFIDFTREFFEDAENKKQWTIGPVLPNYKKLDYNDNINSNRNEVCLDWLDKQPPGSVLFVSFGTSVMFEDAEIKELAMGLIRAEQSKVHMGVERCGCRNNYFLSTQ